MSKATQALAGDVDAPKLEFRKPALLTMAMVFFFLFSAMTLIIVPLMLLSSGGSYSINGVAVTHDEFVARSRVFIIGFPLLAIYVGAMAFALYQQRPWSRPLLAVYLPLVGILTILSNSEAMISHPQPGAGGDVAASAIGLAVLSLVAVWYLYRKRSVVAYYRAIQPRDSSSPA